MKVTVDGLLAELFYERSHLLYPEVKKWLRASKRFQEFSAENSSKIRSKLRNTVEADALSDLHFELETALWFLNDKRFSLTYEEHGVRTRRGPDFVVTFTSKLSFGVEVTRLKLPSQSEIEESNPERQLWRLGNIIASKLGQMNSEMGNFLMMGSESAQVSRIDLDETMRHFKRRAQEKDETLINRSGLGNSSTLFKHFQRLSGILLRSMPDSVPSLPPIIWTNPETRYPLPSPILTALKTNCMV